MALSAWPAWLGPVLGEPTQLMPALLGLVRTEFPTGAGPARARELAAGPGPTRTGSGRLFSPLVGLPGAPRPGFKPRN